MEWLKDSALTKRKQQLKPAITKVTTRGGVQYIEPRSEIHSNAKSSFRSRPGNLTINSVSSCHPGYIVDEKPDLQIGCITKNLLIGSVDAASDGDLLQKHHVTHILSVAPLRNYEVPINAKHLCLDILDLPETDLSPYYNRAFTFIDEAIADDGSVLIHCNAGVSRSAAITIAYLMHSKALSYETAWHMVKEKRPAINPNMGFILQLKSFEQQNINKTN